MQNDEYDLVDLGFDLRDEFSHYNQANRWNAQFNHFYKFNKSIDSRKNIVSKISLSKSSTNLTYLCCHAPSFEIKEKGVQK